MFDSLWVSMKSFSVIIQIKDNEHEYFPVILFVMPYKVVSPYLTLNTSIPPEVEQLSEASTRADTYVSLFP